MALRRNRLPRFWLGITLGLVLTGTGAALWWERQLPERLEAAAARGDLEACLRYGNQLEALRWQRGTVDQARSSCRRRRAGMLWQEERWAEALQLQLQLVNSSTSDRADEKQLIDWQEQLQRRALVRYRDGDLDGALLMLAAMGEDRRADGTSVGDRLREGWTRNRLQLERASRLVREKRWFESLDALNRIDHPWWKARSLSLRGVVEQGIAGLEREHKEHDAHGSLAHTVPTEQLDAEVQRLIASGMDEWRAFQSACRSLGGKIVEAGPESACQR
ncbi:MAG: hypothetical protein VKK98_00455 [Cyanobacteriota bacterium]|nr:hypothetical protein [Cyanobacteriota bacterium]